MVRVCCLIMFALVFWLACQREEEVVPRVGTPAEREWLATNSRVLVYAPDPDYPPYE